MVPLSRSLSPSVGLGAPFRTASLSQSSSRWFSLPDREGWREWSHAFSPSRPPLAHSLAALSLPGRRAGRLPSAATGGSQPRAPTAPAAPRKREAEGSRRSRCILHCHRDPTRRQRLPRERPSAPGARGKSPSAPMNERLPHDGHARGRGFPSPLPSSGNPL